MLFQDPQKPYTESLSKIKANLSPVFYPSLLNASFESFLHSVASSAGLKKFTHRELFETITGFDADDIFRVMIQANSLSSDIEIQKLYQIIVGVQFSEIQCYQVENIYFANCPIDWKKISNPSAYLNAQLATTWSDPFEKLGHCYRNWHHDDAKADIIIINNIKNTVLGYMLVDARRIQKYISPKIAPASFSAWLFLEVLKQKEHWFPLRGKIIDSYYQDTAAIERAA